MKEVNVKFFFAVVLLFIGIVYITFFSPELIYWVSNGLLGEHVIFLLFPFAGITMLIIGGSLLSSDLKRRRRMKKLDCDGIVKSGKIIEFKKTFYHYNHRRLCRIIAETENHETYSSGLYIERIIKKYCDIGDKVNIIIDAVDKEIYKIVIKEEKLRR